MTVQEDMTPEELAMMARDILITTAKDMYNFDVNLSSSTSGKTEGRRSRGMILDSLMGWPA